VLDDLTYDAEADPPAAIPEPGTLVMLTVGLTGLLERRRRRTARAAARDALP
jgi:PEP-CTERM motif